MYRLGHRIMHHYIRYVGIVLGISVVGLGSVLWARSTFQAHTVLKQSSPVTHVVLGTTTTTQHITKSIFAFNLPSDWHAVQPPQFAYTVYSWAGDSPTSDTRRLDVYVDTIPTKLAVNHLLPVQADGDHIDITGTTSDNCVSFTDPSGTSAASGSAPSKWGGVNFLCDMANYERDVVGIGSPEGSNTTTLVGPTSGRHHIMLVYTDNSINPDYSVLVAIVKSFQLL